MSEGPRLAHAKAAAAATLLLEQWGINTPDCMIAGSVRRKALTVGDLDLVAPLPEEGKRDTLFERIDSTLVRTGGLFGNASGFAEAIQGVKPGFKVAMLRVQLRITVGSDAGGNAQSEVIAIPVQIHRYTPANRGWVELMKTGPTEFNVWFLSCWKQRWGIPAGKEHHALVDNHLVDGVGTTAKPDGSIVPVATERECFERCGVAIVPPWERDAFMAAERVRSGRFHKEAMR
jgi:hypothetical protein